MIKDETWQELAKRTGLAADKLKEVIASEKEEDIELSSVTILNDDQLNELKETIGKSSAKNGAKTMIEMEVKALRDKHELSFEGKTIDNLLSAFADKKVSEAKIEPNKKVTDALESIKNLQNTYNNDIGLKDSEIAKLTNRLTEFKTNGELVNHIPDGLHGIDSRDFLTIAKTKAEFTYDDEGSLVVMEGGKIKRDKMEKPISPKQWLTDLAIEKKWVESGGRGGDNSSGGQSGFKTMNDLFKHMETNKINPLSAAGKKLVEEFNNLK